MMTTAHLPALSIRRGTGPTSSSKVPVIVFPRYNQRAYVDVSIYIAHSIVLLTCSQAFILLREFILGHNETGLVTSFHGHTSVVGGEDHNFGGVMTGQSGIYYGSGATHYTYTYPSLTIAEWETFIAVATDTPFSPTTSGHHVARTAP